MEVIEIKESMFRLDEWEPEYENGSLGSGSSKVDPPGVRYHVRITLKKELTDIKRSAKFLALNYTNRWCLSKYIWGLEYSESGQPHLHGAITIPQAYQTGTMSKFFKNFKHLTEGVPGYHHELEKDEAKNVVYCCKDEDIIYTNYSSSALEIIKNKILAIKEDMNLKTWEKIVNRLQSWADNLTYEPEIWELKIKIGLIYKEWRKQIPGGFRNLVGTVALHLGVFSDRELGNYL